MSVGMYVCMYVGMSVRMCVCLYVGTYVCMFVCRYVSVYECTVLKINMEYHFIVLYFLRRIMFFERKYQDM
jgi:hypothetical protein